LPGGSTAIERRIIVVVVEPIVVHPVRSVETLARKLAMLRLGAHHHHH